MSLFRNLMFRASQYGSNYRILLGTGAETCMLAGTALTAPHARNIPGWTKVRFSTVTNPRFTPAEEAKFREVEAWWNSFSRDSVPFSSFEVNFARSSGPGGQNVNKVNTKAELRFPLSSASWLHPWVRNQFRIKFPRYITSDGDVVVSSDEHRTQKQNLEQCRKKLLEAIEQCARVPSATSEEQQRKVQKLAEIADAKRRQEKEKLKTKKAERKGSDYGTKYI